MRFFRAKNVYFLQKYVFLAESAALFGMIFISFR